MLTKTAGLCAVFLVVLVGTSHLSPHAFGTAVGAQGGSSKGANQVPIYEWDPTWPKQPPLPKNWVTGPTVGVSVDALDHIWVVHRPRGALSGTQSECCVPAPAVIEFDQAGKVVQAWGGPRAEDFATSGGRGAPARIPTNLPWTAPANYDWPGSEHNIFVDYKDNVWLGNNAGYHIVKFNRQGKFLLQIGRPGVKGQGSNDTASLMGPTGITVDPKANEVYVADGYGNRRVIVFDADSGAYKRHWGAYGKKPDDAVPVKEVEYKPGAPPPQQFDTVHCVLIDKDDLVWVCDRANSRIQVFKKDGTFVKEGWIAPPPEGIMPSLRAFTVTSTKKTMLGSVFDLAFSRDADQRFVFVPDGRRERVVILRRSDMKTIGSIGQQGHWGGSFTLAHNIAVDSKNNLYVSESAGGSRVQRFLYKGF